MKERIKAGSAQHYEWVVGNGRSKVGATVDGVMCVIALVALVVVFVCLV